MMNCGVVISSLKWIRYSGWSLVFFWFFPVVLSAQPVTFSEAFVAAHQAVQSTTGSTCTTASFSSCPAAPEYNLIALRVSFQPDTSRFTTGNGTFEGALFDSLEAKVDPLPHDAAYFEAHLQFLSNYIDQVSDGNTQVNTHLIPEVIQLSNVMGAYSPTGLESASDAELSKLAGLVEEAWQRADTEASLDVSGFDPATTAFMIFHAGVGRDIELVGTTLDKTPEDIPTIFFNAESLSRLLGQSLSFKGLPVQHTMILPRTESRQGFDFIQDEPFLVEFSINGLMAASFFNYLGVPDLFNTESGESAIGPFGLMDPLGLFAFNGLFPPEPSGWTKQYLGWTTPIVIDGEQPIEMELLAASGQSTMELARVPISESEYFLVENRYRDLANDGLVLTIYRDGQIIEQRIENGQEDFNSFNIDAFEGGVVVDVDDYDWALPGGRDENENPLLGGMLVWHIDEQVLAAKLAANQVNSDPELRAVDLEEADSAQDLGFPLGSIFGPQAHLGTPFDFFYEGNPVVVISNSGEEISLYQNRFGADTVPNSQANAGGDSFIELQDFGTPGPAMSFTYARDASGSVQLVDGFPQIGEAAVPPLSYVTAAADPENGVFFLGATDELVGAFTGGPVFTTQLTGNPLSSPIVFPGDQVVALKANPDGTASLAVQRGNSISDFPLDITIGQTSNFYSRNALLYEAESGLIYAMLNSSTYSGLLEIRLNSTNATATEVNLPAQQIYSIAATSRGEVGVLANNGFSWVGSESAAWNVDFIGTQIPGQLVLGEDNSGTMGAFTLPASSEVIYMRADGQIDRIDMERFGVPGSLSSLSVLVDLDRDGRLDVLVSKGSSLLAVTSGGGLIEGFPLDAGSSVTTQPLVAMGREANWIVVAGTQEGQIHAFDVENDGRQLIGFPLSAGFSITATPLIDQSRIYAVSASGRLSVWETSLITDTWWGVRGANRFHTHFVRSVTDAPIENTEGLFVENGVYNWPNPIRQGRTFFRLTSATDVDVRITVIDAAGMLVDEIQAGLVRAQAPVDVAWETEVGSGLYFARVEATDASGNTETSLIKMAVIR